MDDELNKAAMWSSANNTNKRLIFIVNAATSYFFTIYMSFTFEMDIGKGVLAIDIYNFIVTRLAERYRWRCADLHNVATKLSWMHSGLQHI